ncbi:MAG: glycoside hydrolase family 95 protein [Bacteroidaceae bacterium]|nr:glycoside hydrolase family 95 protein [Bacteroidaceae bacterium]
MKRTFLLMFALLCLVVQGWAIDFTVSVTGGTTSGGAVYNGKTYKNGATISVADDYEKSDFSVVSIFGYSGKLDLDRTNFIVKVVYSVSPAVSTDEKSVWYQIKFKNGGAVLQDNGSGQNVTTANADVTLPNQQWCVLSAGTNYYYIVSNGGNYLSFSNSRFQTNSDQSKAVKVKLPQSTNDKNYYEIQRNGTSQNMNQWGGAGSGKELGEWTAGDPNNPLTFIEVEYVEPVSLFSTDSKEYWYNVKFNNSGLMIQDNGADAKATVQNANNANSQLWKLVGNASKFQMISKNGRYAHMVQSSTNSGQTYLVYTKSTEDASGFSLKENGGGYEIKWNGTSDGKAYFNQWEGASAGRNIGLWSSDAGNVVFFVDPAATPAMIEVPITGISSFTPKNPNTLWYKTSAEATKVKYPWMEYALPLGNGELGCMVFGGVFKEEIQFNEKTLWSGPANVVGAASGNRTFMNFGSLFVENLDGDINKNGVTDYVRYLDIEEGIAGVEFKNANGTKFTRKYFSSAPDQVIVGRYTAEGSDKMYLFFTMEAGESIGANDVVYDNGTIVFTGAMQSVNHAARVHIKSDGSVITGEDGISVFNASYVEFYLKGATNFNGDMNVLNNYFTSETPTQVSKRAKAEIEKAIAKGYEQVESDHIEDFTTITKRMTFNLGLKTPTVDTKALVDKYYPNNSNATSTANDHLFLEQLYFHFGRYLAISSNRKPIAAPNNLQGIWNDRGTNSPWNSDIHTNINIQMNYWPTEITNLSDLHKPFVNFIIRGAKSSGWKKVGEDFNGGYGWSVLTETSLYNSMSTWGSNYLVANVWYTSHLWTHWRYTQDKEFLAKAFPVMWDCAEFWFHRLIEDRGFDNTKDEQASVRNYHTPYKFEPDGTLVAPNEFSAEQHDNESEDGTAHAQQMIYYLFQNLSEAISILGLENTGLTTEDVATLNHYLEKTDKGLHTETYTGSWGSTYNDVKTGDKLLREWKYSPFDISNDRGHRHMSHMMALFPMDQITPESEYFTPAVNSLKLRGDAATGWSMGWKVNLWARAQDGDHAHIIIKNALKHSTDYGTNAGAGGIYYNLFDSHAPFQIDGNFGVCSGIAEMLMQSAHGYINVLPALPKVWNKQGDVKGMKAIGNFTVDFSWSAGKCQSIRIESHAGAPLKLRCLKGAMALDQASVKVNGVEVAVTVNEHSIAEIPCEQGDIVEVDFTTATGISSVAGNGAGNGATEIYDLSGRRLSEVHSGQVYIQNGQKKVSK